MIFAERRSIGRPTDESTRGPTFDRMALAARVRRLAGAVQWISAALICVALLVLVRALPVDRAIDVLTSKVDGLGYWGPLVLGATYVAAALAFVPGSALTVAAGAVFGLAWGTVTVSIASTATAALAFLIARHVARDWVALRAREHPRFKAIDQAISVGGWRIVAMLRLSPTMPFSLGNYLFGLTAIRFWPYLVTSWLCMLPGTFMYVYLGHIGIEGVRTAAGAQGGMMFGEWALLGIGLVAAVAVTVYVTGLARKALREQTRLGEDAQACKNTMKTGYGVDAAAAGWPWRTTALATGAVVLVAVAACTHQRRGALQNLFGPAPVTLREAYQHESDGPTFDHSEFGALLRKHVDDDGWVDYDGLRRDATSLDGYIASLANAPFADLGRDDRLALLINAYNAFTVRLILDHYPIKSIKEIPSAKRWDDKRWRVGKLTLSLNDIEHKQIRPKFREPRIHFALVCAAIGCPPLRAEAYSGAKIEDQLADQTRYVHAHDRWFHFDAPNNVVKLTRLYDWYGGDFKQVAGSVVEYAARYVMSLKHALDRSSSPQVEWLAYNWALNDQKNR